MAWQLDRATLGRLAAYSVAPVSGAEVAFVASDFAAPPNCTVGTTSGLLFIQALSSNIFQRVAAHIASGSLADVFIVVETDPFSGAAQVGAGARSDGIAYPANSGILGDVPVNGAFSVRVIEVVGGSQIQADSTAASLTGIQRVSLWTKGTTAKSFAFGPGVESEITGVGLAAAGGVGPTYNRGAAGTVEYRGVWIMRDALFTVNGPVGTWRVDILDGGGVVLATAASVAGVASLDLFAARIEFPEAVTVEVRDTGTDALLVSAAPTERLWGGDVWTLSDDTPVPPDAPGAPTVDGATATTLDVSWDAVATATSYVAERSTSALGPWTEVYEGAEPGFTDTGLSPNTTYFYRASACNAAGCSAFGISGNGTTLDLPVPPGSPRFYRFRVRNASTEANPDGTADVIVATSVRGGVAPYIPEPPKGDGQEIDILTGGIRTGTYTIKVIDAPTGSDSTGTIRFITNTLEDADFRQQLLSRRAYIEESVDGSTWTVLQAGYVVNLKLASAITWSFSIGDTRRIETSRRVFTWSREPGPSGVSERDVFPGRGCLVGGPIIGGFGPLQDTGGDEWNIDEAFVNDQNFPGRVMVGMSFRWAFVPPNFTRTRSVVKWFLAYARALDPFRESYLQDPETYPAWLRNILSKIYGWYPALTIEIRRDADVWYGTPRGFVDNKLVAILDEASSVTPPTTGRVQIRMYQTEVSEKSPLYIDRHPVDLVTDLFQTIGYQWDAASAAAVRSAIGDDLRYALRITQAEPMLDFLTKSVFGPFGFTVRNNDEGKQEFILTRPRKADAPATSITIDDLRSGDPVVFTLDEQSIVSSFRIGYKILAVSERGLDASPPPPSDGIAVASQTVVLSNSDVGVFATKEVGYEFVGMVHHKDSWNPAMGPLISAIGREGFDRFGRGAPEANVEVLRTSAAAALADGDEVLLDVAHYPNRGYRIGESDVGARIMQIVRKTIHPGYVSFKCIDSGLDLQPVSPDAEISIAASTSAPRTVALFTITNAATINATNALSVAVEYATGASEPTGSGVLFARYAPGAVPTLGVALPTFVPASHVWVRARTEQPERRPSAWSAWADVSLGAFNPPSAVTISGITAESFALAWTNADASYVTELFISPGSIPPASWDAFRVQIFLPGTTQTVIRGLDAATTYIVGVAHRDPVTGARTTVATDSDTTAANSSTAPTPISFQVIPSEDDADADTGIALALFAANESFNIDIERADDASGAPGEWAAIATVPGTTTVYRDRLPTDGATRWYQIRHSLPGFDPSNFTGSQSGIPAALPENVNRPLLGPTLIVDVTKGDPDYTIAWRGTGTIEVNIDGGGFGAPPASPITVTRDASVHEYLFRATLNGIEVEQLVVIPVESTPSGPSLTSVSRTESQAIDCGVSWIISVGWVTTGADDTNFKIVVRDFFTSAIIADSQTTSSSSYLHDTGAVGDPGQTGVVHSERYTIEVVRLSDSLVIDTMDTAEISVETGPAC